MQTNRNGWTVFLGSDHLVRNKIKCNCSLNFSKDYFPTVNCMIPKF